MNSKGGNMRRLRQGGLLHPLIKKYCFPFGMEGSAVDTLHIRSGRSDDDGDGVLMGWMWKPFMMIQLAPRGRMAWTTRSGGMSKAHK
jgi:hypothetical protein